MLSVWSCVYIESHVDALIEYYVYNFRLDFAAFSIQMTFEAEIIKVNQLELGT